MRSATAAGTSRICTSRLMRLSRTRRKSPSSKRGWQATSASSSVARAPCADQRDQADRGRVWPDLAFEMRADARQRVVEREAVERPGALVEEVGGERGQAEAIDGIGGAPDRPQHAEADHRQPVVLHRPDAQAVGAGVLGDRREVDAA